MWSVCASYQSYPCNHMQCNVVRWSVFSEKQSTNTNEIVSLTSTILNSIRNETSNGSLIYPPSTPKKILCQINMHYVYHISHLSIWTLTLNETNRKETFIIWKKLTNWVSGFEHSGHSTKRLIKPSKSDWSLLASWEPLTIKRSFLKSNMVCAPNSHPKNFVGSVIRGKNVQVK